MQSVQARVSLRNSDFGGLGLWGGGGTRCLGRDVGLFVKFEGLWPLG